MPKIFLVSALIAISCLITAGGAKAFTPNPEAPDNPPLRSFWQTARPSILPLLDPIAKEFVSSTQQVLPLPPDWMMPIVVSTTVEGTIQSVSTTFTLSKDLPATSGDDIGVIERPTNSELMRQLFRYPPLLPRITSSTVGVVNLYIPALNTTTQIIIREHTNIRDVAQQIIDTTELVPGDTIVVNGVRFRNNFRFIFADAIERINKLPYFLRPF